MSTTLQRINTIRSEISVRQAEVARLQAGCAHKMTFVSQHIPSRCDSPSTEVTLKCSECDLDKTQRFRAPVCPKHVCEMIAGTDEKSKELARIKRKELDEEPGYYAAFPFKCPHCEERIVLAIWDQ